MMEGDLSLKVANEVQIQETWKNTCEEWGRGLTLEQYIEREQLLRSCPFTSENLKVWVLVPKNDPETLDLLSHLEVITRSAYVRRKSPTTEQIHTVLSVFTPVGHRKKGYATIMLEKLSQSLRLSGIGSILFSSVGKFYEKFGYKIFSPFHTALPVFKTCLPSTDILFLNEDSLKEVSFVDCELVKNELGENSLMIEPNFDTYYWHVQRSRFYAKHSNLPQPEIFGVKYVSDDSNGTNLQFIAWVCDYTLKKLLFLRHRLRDKAPELIKAAQHYAHSVGMDSVLGWNLDKSLLENMHFSESIEVIRRDTESLPSLLLFDCSSNTSLDWKGVQRYTWA